MRISSVKASNFGSYRDIELEFKNGLILVSGPTGSGKSTVCDLVPWVLFGRTSKDGAADEIRSWNAEGPTSGSVTLDINGRQNIVVRTRKPNDLYYIKCDSTSSSDAIRGKDLNDTQKLINELLGTNADKFLSSAYYHEFSKVASFFISTPNDRRQMMEQLADLSLAVRISDGLKTKRSTLKNQMSSVTASIDTLQNQISRLESSVTAHKSQMDNWETEHIRKVEQLIVKVEGFEHSEDNRLAKLKQEHSESCKMSRCPTCGTPGKFNGQVTKLDTERRMNPYIGLLESTTKQVSPLASAVDFMQDELKQARASYNKHDGDLQRVKIDTADCFALGEIVDDFRVHLITKTVSGLEKNTNRLLTNHFDAEIKVSFDTTHLHKLDISIVKDGFACSFGQLSKGQRQILKLCFGVSVMQQVSNYSGVSSNVSFFDEALDGLDEVMRVKAYKLFQELATQYESIFVVDHSPALKELFTNRLEVTLHNGVSSIEKS